MNKMPRTNDFRNAIRSVLLQEEWLTIGKIAGRSGLDRMAVSKAISSMVRLQKTIEKRKVPGAYAEYKLILTADNFIVRSVTLKLAYLKKLNEKIPVGDRQMLNEIITDYEHFLQVKSLNKACK